MQHFKIRIRALLAISLILGFALVTFGCDTNKLFSDVFASSKSLQSVDKEVVIADYSYNANGDLLGFTEYEHDSKGNMTKFRNYDSNKELSGYAEIEYDSNGNYTKISHYYANGKLLSCTNIEYDSNGHETKSNFYANTDEEFSSYTEYEYDSNGNQTKWREYTVSGELLDYAEYEYDSKGNQIKWSLYHADGKLSVKVVSDYDSNNNLTKLNRDFYANEELSSYDEYEWYSNGNIKKCSAYNANGELNSYTVYIYMKI